MPSMLPLLRRCRSASIGALFVIVTAAPAHAQMTPPSESATDRFLRYVKIDTQSADGQTSTPSTPKQLDLARLLARELTALDVRNVRLSDSGIVYGTIPGNLPDNTRVPTIGFIAHMDTSDAVSGANVTPVVHANYQGGDIVLPGDPSQVITAAQNPDLQNLLGDDIITADGTTLLGSDDKAGCAEIMTMIDMLRRNPQIAHGHIVVAFTPDEEIGTGVDAFDIPAWGATFAYTVDGEELGEISNETWSARTATVTFHGRSTHPGTAKGLLVNAMFAAADFLGRFPPDMLPETTEGRVGFVHPDAGTLGVELTSIKILIRDFDLSGIAAKEAMLQAMVGATQARFPAVKIDYASKLDYLNMKETLQAHPEVTEFAFEAARRAGVKPFLRPVRGGTDGSTLTARGLPTPNLFTGGHNFHGKLEFNSRRGLEQSAGTLVNLVQVWAERGATR